MTEADGLQHSLAAMGFPELGLALALLCCYALAFNGALSVSCRTSAAGCALLAAGGFAAMTDPWVYGVILIALGIVGMGIFTGIVWAMSAFLGVARDVPREPMPDMLPEDAAPPANAAPGVPVTRRPAHSA